eukprot:scaffold547_cov384-Prasinococcus_capsulatus_cf.AAC.14
MLQPQQETRCRSHIPASLRTFLNPFRTFFISSLPATASASDKPTVKATNLVGASYDPNGRISPRRTPRSCGDGGTSLNVSHRKRSQGASSWNSLTLPCLMHVVVANLVCQAGDHVDDLDGSVWRHDRHKVKVDLGPQEGYLSLMHLILDEYMVAPFIDLLLLAPPANMALVLKSQ